MRSTGFEPVKIHAEQHEPGTLAFMVTVNQADEDEVIVWQEVSYRIPFLRTKAVKPSSCRIID